MRVQYPKSFMVLDNADIDAMLQIVYEERGLTLRDMTFSAARDMIEMLKLKERPDYFLDMLAMPLENLHQKYLLRPPKRATSSSMGTCIKRRSASGLITTTSSCSRCISSMCTRISS